MQKVVDLDLAGDSGDVRNSGLNRFTENHWSTLRVVSRELSVDLMIGEYLGTRLRRLS